MNQRALRYVALLYYNKFTNSTVYSHVYIILVMCYNVGHKKQ